MTTTPNKHRTAFEDWTAKEHISPSVKPRIRIEQKIARFTVRALLRAGFVLSVYDGEEITVSQSSDAAAICNAMFTTDEDYLYVYKPGEKVRFGWVRFVYGNDGYDVICDYTTNLDPQMDAVNEYANAFGG
jgi:hypothetical protein